MTKVVNNPERFADDALEGFASIYRDYVRSVRGGVVRRTPGPDGKVAVLVGGGSGHYPAFMGWVGPGFADGAVCGNIFSAPSAQYAVNVARAANRGGGVIFGYGNHAGDVLNFGMAADQLNAEGIQAASMVVTDDIVAAPPGQEATRRGIAGDFTVFKVIGAAAEAGCDFDEVLRVGAIANERTRTIGIGLSGCTMPGASEPLFVVEPGTMGIGLGLHGEPGIADVPLGTADEIARALVEPLLKEAPGDSTRLAVLLNGLGSTKYEELYVLWTPIATLLRDAGYELVAPEVGELITSLDMAGMSLTITWLTDEIEPYWLAPCDSPAFRRNAVGAAMGGGTVASAAGAFDDADEESSGPREWVASPESRRAAAMAVRAFAAVRDAIVAAEEELGRIDAIAGDGDHGRGMVKGIGAASSAARAALDEGAGLGDVIDVAGEAWITEAGGTSGVLWGSALSAAGRFLGNEDATAEAAIRAVELFAETLQTLGKARAGDKTMLDAALPFAAALRAGFDRGDADPLGAAVAAAQHGARETADLLPKVGRARPLAEKSLGTPDPGATSFAIAAEAVAAALAQ